MPLTMLPFLLLFSHCMVGVGCPVALQETDAESPSFRTISLWLRLTDGNSEGNKHQKHHTCLNSGGQTIQCDESRVDGEEVYIT